MEGQLRQLRNGIHPRTGAGLPPAIEFDDEPPPSRDENIEDERTRPDGFYKYAPTMSMPALTPIVHNGMTSTDRRAAFHERIKAKEKANQVTSQVMSGSSADTGGGVWECLFAGEEQFPGKRDRRFMATACRGKYRIKVKGAACRGGNCCKGTSAVRYSYGLDDFPGKKSFVCLS